MSLRSRAKDDPKDTLFGVLGDVRVGMLGPAARDEHMQPMTHHPEQETSTLWFIAAADTDLVRNLRPGERFHHCVVGQDHNYHVCLSGIIRISDDRAKLEELWSLMVSAWFPEGKADPEVRLLELRLEEAAIWASSENPLAIGIELVRSVMERDHAPDVGDRMTLRFGHQGV